MKSVTVSVVPSSIRSIVLHCAAVMLIATTASAQSVRADLWGANNWVNSVVTLGNRIFIAGDFNWVGPSTGAFTALDIGSGAIMAPHTGIAGTVNAIASDGNGGWYIGGKFTRVLGESRNGLAQIAADGHLTRWNPQPGPNSEIFALVVNNDTIYVGGSFSSIGGQPRQNIAALDLSGAVTSWNPGASGGVRALAVAGNTVYAGGNFSGLGGQLRLVVGAVDATTGTVTAFDAGISYEQHEAIEVDVIVPVFFDTVYIGGVFNHVGNSIVPGLAMLNGTTGAVQPFNAQLNGTVTGIIPRGAPAPTSLLVCGHFSTVGGVLRKGLAEIDAASGALLPWNPLPDGTWVTTMQLSDGTLYVAGDFNNIGGAPRYRIAGVDVVTGAAAPWNPGGAALPITCIAVGADAVVVGGNYLYGGDISGQPRSRMAAFDAVTGALTDWNPNANNTVQALATDGNVIYAGGWFTSIGGQSRNFIAALDPITGAATNWNPDSGNIVRGIEVDGNSVFVRGQFFTIGGKNRQTVAELDRTTGLATNWNANLNSSFGPAAMAVEGSLVYLGGGFTLPRNQLASFNRTTGAVTAWNPNPNGYPGALAASGNRVYVGGTFTTIADEARNGLAAFDTGVLMPWDPSPDATVYALNVAGDKVYAAGPFTAMAGQPRLKICSFDMATGSLTGWTQNVTAGDPHNLYSDGQSIYAGGAIRAVEDIIRGGFAAFTSSPTAVTRTPLAARPLNLRASPNPFGGDVSLIFDLRTAAKVDVDVYDVAGRLVRKLHGGTRAAGEQRLSWDGRDSRGSHVGGGVYFARVRAGTQNQSIKVLLVR